jgi:microcompartment protein CcmL/EutN
VKRAIGLIELRSIARGIETTDVMLKAADVELLRAHATCPGKYVVLIAGDVGAVRSAVAAGEQVAPGLIVDTFVLPNVHPSIFPAWSATTEIDQVRSVGIIETYTLAASIVAADIAVKAANIDLIEIRLPFALGGKAFVIFSGDVSSVRTAVDTAVTSLKDDGVIESYTVIASPHKSLIEKVL